MTAVRLSSESVKSASECNSNVFWASGILSEEAPVQWPEGFPGRGVAIGDVLRKLEGREIPGKEYLAEYLRDQHRRYCRPNTLRSTLSNIGIFLIFVKAKGKCHLDEIQREDLFSFIEHEQDRGMKPSTVSTQLRRVKGFIRFLVDKVVVGSDLISKRLTVKVPDSLPRAMEPEDVAKLVSIIEHTRDRAMVQVM